MNWQEHLPALILAIPLLGAFATPLFSLGGKTLRNVWMVSLSFLTLVLAFLIWKSVTANGVMVYVMGGEQTTLTLPSGMAYPIRIILEIDAFSAFMALAGSIVSFAGALYSVHFMDRFSGMSRFTSLYFLLTTGMLGLMVTGDLFNFFVFLEIASAASFGLIAFWRDRPIIFV
jgi:multicomponent Na+:H+ antiporter subunit D